MIDKSVFMVYNKFATQNVVLYLSHRGLILADGGVGVSVDVLLYLSHRGLIPSFLFFFFFFFVFFTFPIGD